MSELWICPDCKTSDDQHHDFEKCVEVLKSENARLELELKALKQTLDANRIGHPLADPAQSQKGQNDIE